MGWRARTQWPEQAEAPVGGPAVPAQGLQDAAGPGAGWQKLLPGVDRLVCKLQARPGLPVPSLSTSVGRGESPRWLLALESLHCLLVLISLNPGALREEPSLSLRCNTRETVKLEKITSFECREISAGWLILGKYLF